MDGELEQLGERIAEQAAHFDAAMHRILADLREFDQRGGWHRQGAMTCAHWLSWRVGWDLGTARDRVRVAKKLGEFPTIDDALRRGEISYSKARALVRVATPANEALLLEHAQLMTAAQLETLSRKYALVQRHGKDPHPMVDEQRRFVRRRDTEDGMVKIEAVLHPEEAELVWIMLNDAAARLVREPVSSVADSAETECAMSDHVAVAVPHQAESAACQMGNSAETRNAMSGHVAVAVPHHAESAVGEIGNSAETGDAFPDQADTEATQQAEASQEAERAACELGDSAESREVLKAGVNAMLLSRVRARVNAIVLAEETQPVAHARSAESTQSTGACASETGTDVVERTRAEAWVDRPADAGAAVDRVAAGGGLDRGAAAVASGSEPGPSGLRQRSDATKRAFNRADALVSIAQGYLRGGQPNRSPVEIMLTISDRSLRAQDADPIDVADLGEGFVSRETARRLSCDAGVIEVTEGAHGEPLSVGRKRRTITGALKHALRKRDAACTFPGCTHKMFLEGHHIQHWADGGESSVLNAALLCSHHHRYVHEYRYLIELGPDQRPRFRDPSGRLVMAVPEQTAIPDLGWPQIRAANEPLAIDAETIACGWDGTRVDYGAIVGHLVTADGLS